MSSTQHEWAEEWLTPLGREKEKLKTVPTIWKCESGMFESVPCWRKTTGAAGPREVYGREIEHGSGTSRQGPWQKETCLTYHLVLEGRGCYPSWICKQGVV